MRKEPYRLKTVEVVKVIKVQYTQGKGTKEDPVRTVTEHWDLDHNLISRVDPCAKKEGE